MKYNYPTDKFIGKDSGSKVIGRLAYQVKYLLMEIDAYASVVEIGRLRYVM